MNFKSVEEITNLVMPLVDSMGLELVEVEPKLGKTPSLTFYLDKEGGIDLDTLEEFHRSVDGLLDELDVSNGAQYTLNVSSPGLCRPFKTERDYLKRIGKDVEVKLFSPIKGVKFFEGTLKEYDKNYVVLVVNEQEIKINHNQIAKINEAVKFD